MEKFQTIVKKILFFLSSLLILIYLLLEELVWERFAQPLFRYIKYLRPFEKLEEVLAKSNKYVVLTLFTFSLIIGEGFGVLSPIIALKGYPILAIVFYGLKIVVAAFAFWVFNTQKKLLLSFAWLKFFYDKIVLFTEWIKSTEVYIKVKQLFIRLKLFLKEKIRKIKAFWQNYF